jgi:DNA-binding XRE family transcriptional regulator
MGNRVPMLAMLLARISNDLKSIFCKLARDCHKNMLKIFQLLDIFGSSVYPKNMITRAQIRAARALIDWTQSDLAQASGVSQVAIKNLERGATDPRVSTINNIQAAFDQAGVIFLDAGDIRIGGVGVRIKGPAA